VIHLLLRADTLTLVRSLAAALAVAAIALPAQENGPQAAAVPGVRFSFDAFGDTPYFAFEEVRLEKLIPEMNAQPLAFVLHVGDDVQHGTVQIARMVNLSRCRWESLRDLRPPHP
jgi:hypothetical protein